LHREDGPAVEWADGRREWWLHGERHREDGPALEWADGQARALAATHSRLSSPESAATQPGGALLLILTRSGTLACQRRLLRRFGGHRTLRASPTIPTAASDHRHR
jgi:hypothetical protein